MKNKFKSNPKRKRSEVKQVPPKFIEDIINAHKDLTNRVNDLIETVRHLATVIVVLQKKGIINDEEVQQAFDEVVANQQNKHTESIEGSDIRPKERSDDENHSGSGQSNILPSPFSGDDSDSATS